jgi:hypothetical protein
MIYYSSLSYCDEAAYVIPARATSGGYQSTSFLMIKIRTNRDPSQKTAEIEITSLGGLSRRF